MKKIKYENENIAEAISDMGPGCLKHVSGEKFWSCHQGVWKFLIYWSPNRWTGCGEFAVAVEMKEDK